MKNSSQLKINFWSNNSSKIDTNKYIDIKVKEKIPLILKSDMWLKKTHINYQEPQFQ